MEVHAHSHTERKKWTHYLWEFLMLFLAVFCGFLAEYQLEHQIEKEKEKEFIISLAEDLAEDTVTFNNDVVSYSGNIKRLDTLMLLLTSPEIKNYGSDLYYFGRRASRGNRLGLHDRTIQQMKNSGGFRLIRKKNVSKAILEYYNRLNFIEMLQNIELNELEEYRKIAVDVFHPLIFDSIIKSDNNVVRPGGNPALLTYDKTTLLRLAGQTAYIKNTRTGFKRTENEMKDEAKKLIDLLKHEYHLK